MYKPPESFYPFGVIRFYIQRRQEAKAGALPKQGTVRYTDLRLPMGPGLGPSHWTNPTPRERGHFTGEETEVQRGDVTGSQLHSRPVAEPGSLPGLSDAKVTGKSKMSQPDGRYTLSLLLSPALSFPPPSPSCSVSLSLVLSLPLYLFLSSSPSPSLPPTLSLWINTPAFGERALKHTDGMRRTPGDTAAKDTTRGPIQCFLHGRCPSISTLAPSDGGQHTAHMGAPEGLVGPPPTIGRPHEGEEGASLQPLG